MHIPCRLLLLGVSLLAPFCSASPHSRRQSKVAEGPCDMSDPETVCRDVVDSSGCWNGVVGPNGSGTATEADAQRLWKCVPGGKDTMCQCYGCDTGLDSYFIRNKLCVDP